MYICIAIVTIAVLILSHELGHFLAARALGVRVNEFALGMGPTLWKREQGETVYSLRLLPFGGYCAMEGEDEASDDPRAYLNQRRWRRGGILLAGSAMNLLFGLLLFLAVAAQLPGFAGNTVAELSPGFPLGGETGLMVGDTILSVDGERVFYSPDLITFLSRAEGSVDMTLLRDGERVELTGLPLRQQQYEGGLSFGIRVARVENTPWESLKYALYSVYDVTRSVRLGLEDLITGRAALDGLMGVVGIVDEMGEAGARAETASAAARSMLFFAGFIAVCLGATNLLPIPALDGGRLFLLLVTGAVEAVTRRKVSPRVEYAINGAGFVLLLGVMCLVMYQDIARIVTGV